MKIVYCNHSVYNPGGMERVMLAKIDWLVRHGYEISLVTTDQKDRPPFFPIPEGVRMTDLGINYSDDNNKNPIVKILGFLWRRRLHRKRLTEYLMRERPDITISLYPCESSFIPDIKDGSKKILELHFNKFFRLQYGRSGILGAIDRMRTRSDEKLVRKFDKFVVLTEEDASYWGVLPNLEVIPNAALMKAPTSAKASDSKRVIAVGRLDFQKGFDRLIKAWALVPSELRKEWHLDIFGQGEWLHMLNEMIDRKGLQESAKINPPTKDIINEYLASSFIVMSSHWEGLPMVLIEAMTLGLPAVCFDFKCGPKDVIQDGVNGLLTPEGNIPALAQAMQRMMDNPKMIEQMSAEAIRIREKYTEQTIMAKWENCFKSIL